MIIEECLRVLTGKAAVVRYLASAAATNPETPDPCVLAGVGEICSEIETAVQALKAALPLEVMGAAVKRRRSRQPD